MDIIEIETRCGLIIEDLVAYAFQRLGVPFKQGFQYDQDCETPDFLIPDASSPKMVIECHQTNVRESLRMKILRLLSAVFEAKVYYGKDIVSVNLLFGNVDLLSDNNLQTFSSFFDVSYFPEHDVEYSQPIKRLESLAREYASNESWTAKDAVAAIISKYQQDLVSLSLYLKKTIVEGNSHPKTELFPIWESEIRRVSEMKGSPEIEEVTEYKSSIIQSLLLSNEDYSVLTSIKDPNKCPEHVKEHLINTGIVSVRPTVTKKYGSTGFLEIQPAFYNLINDPYASGIRDICKEQIDKDPSLGYFFEDIRDESRRIRIAETFISLTRLSKQEFEDALYECLIHGSCFGINHGRCWMADMMPLAVGESQNTFNRLMIASENYHQSLRNPYSNIAIRSPRLGKNEAVLHEHVSVASEVFWNIVSERNISFSEADVAKIAEALFQFRRAATIKLHKLNPLYIAVESICEKLGLCAEYGGVKSFVTDITSAKYDLFTITDGKKEILLNALYKGPDYGSDHKADEWSARRRALGYRMQNGIIQAISNRTDYVFVIDGTWTEKSARKFHNAGWNTICRLWQLEEVLIGIFK